jgi:hypothetical protein
LLPLFGKNPSLRAKTFSMSLIFGEIEKVKLLSYKVFSVSDRAIAKMDKVELRKLAYFRL